MSTRPYYKHFPSDFISGCVGMSAEQIGVYSMLLNLMYARRKKLEARKADDVQALARICGCNTRQFRRILSELAAMENKITVDGDGALSNPRFERWLKTDGKEQTGTKEQQKNGEKTAENSPKNSTKNTPKKQATLFENKDLTPKNPILDARARDSIVHSPKKRTMCIGDPSAGAPPPAEHMDESNFKIWVATCRRSFPTGWSYVKALQRWRKLAFIDHEVLASAWKLYIEDCKQKTKTAKFPQRVQYPENWLRDRVFESYLDEIHKRAEAERNAQAAIEQRNHARTQTIEQWNGYAQKIIAKIGAQNFDRYFVGVILIHRQAQPAELDFGKNDRACSDAEQFHRHHVRDLLPGAIFTSDRRRSKTSRPITAKAKP